jgi:ribosomal protein S18 acetylase RimI-like enzyme
VEPLTRADVPAATATLAAAFADYPLFRTIAPDAGRRPAGCAAFCRMIANYAIRLGHVFATCDRSAVACWLPPGREWFGSLGMLWAGSLRVGWRLGVRGSLMLGRIARSLDATRAAHVSGPHWYLALLGVRPDRKGQGLARVVLGPVFERADRDRLACYLETHDQVNVGIYRRLGFEVVGESEPVPGLRNWGMRRDPR